MAASKLARFLLVTLAVFASSCGSGGNNDQGNSFLAISYTTLSDNNGGCIVDEDTPLVALSVGLQADSTAQSSCYRPLNPPGVRAGYQVTNFLASQRIALRSSECLLRVLQDPSAYIPPVISPMAGVVDDTNDSGGEAVPEVFTTIVSIMSADTLQYINSNLNSYPELPFEVVADCRVTGVSSAGNTFVSNELSLPIMVTEFPESFDTTQSIPPLTGTNGGGGNLTTTSSDSALDSSAQSNESTQDGSVQLEPVEGLL